MAIREVDMLLNNIDEHGNETIGYPTTYDRNVILANGKTLEEAIENGELRIR